MRVLLSTYDSRGGVEPLAALAVRLRALGAEALVCAPPDCADRLAELGVSLVPAGEPVRALVHRATPPSPADVPRLTAELIATWFDTVAAAAEGCDALVASGVIPAAVGARSVAEKLGIHCVHVSYCPIFLPSPHHRPHPLPGQPLPPDVTDNRVLWDLNAHGYNAVYGPALNTHRVANGLPPVDNVRDYILGDRPWLAADPTLAPWPEPADLDAPKDIARVAIEAVRAHGRRALLARGWADLAPIDGQDDCFAVCEVNQQALFGRVAAVVHHGGAGTTTTATLAGAPQVVVPQWADQPYWARRVADLGIGAAHDVQAPTTGSLSAALRTALTPKTRARAAAVAGTIRTDGATVAARLLLDAVSRQRPPVPA
jgi:vancomycin aglycone glucosyltransferase